MAAKAKQPTKPLTLPLLNPLRADSVNKAVKLINKTFFFIGSYHLSSFVEIIEQSRIKSNKGVETMAGKEQNIKTRLSIDGDIQRRLCKYQ